MSSALSPLPLSQALKGPPSLWAPPVQIPIPGGGPAFLPCTGLSPGLPPDFLSSSSGAPGPPASAGCWVQSPCLGFSYVLLCNHTYSCLDLLSVAPEQTAQDRE